MSARSEVGSRYSRVRLLGEGGSGRVWLVEDRLRPGTRLALKEIAGGESVRAADLRREFATLASLRHPNLVEVHDLEVDEASGLPGLVMEYVEGESLVAAVREEGPQVLLELAAEALRALSFLHDFGLVHRDVKPANLLVRARPRLGCRLVVLDFGLAMRGRAGEPAAAGPAGTLAYLAPEVLDGDPADRRSDLYSLGAVLYEAAHGKPPFSPGGTSLAEFVDAVRRGRRSRPPLSEDYPPGLGGWIDNLLSPDPSSRAADASEALARLNAACGTTYGLATPVVRAARLASGRPAGRDAEIEAIWEHLAPSEGPRLVWLCGGPGSGKTRILRWLASDAVTRGWDLSMPAFTPPVEGGTADGKARLLESLRERAAHGPTLALLDEVENAAGPAIDLLERVAREGWAPPLRVVAAIRPGEVRHPELKRLLSENGIVPTLRRVDLEPLDAAGIRALAERATGSPAVSEARVKWLLDASEGSPFAAEALLVQAEWEKGGRARKVLTLDRTASGRLDLLSATGRAWIESLAVLGERAGERIVCRLADLDGETAVEAALEVSAAGLARRRDDRWSPDSRSVAEQVLAGIEPSRRRDLHRRAAEMMGASESPEAEAWRLARLWSGAGRPDLAALSAENAAAVSTAAGDPRGAAEHLAFALRHVGRDRRRRRELRLAQAEALMSSSRFASAARAYGAALGLASSRRERADALSLQARALVLAGRFGRAQAAAEKAGALAREENEPVIEGRALLALGIALGRLCRYEEAIGVLDRALGRFSGPSDAFDRATTLQMIGTCKSNLLRLDGEKELEEAARLFVEAGHPDDRLMPLVGLSWIRQKQGRIGDARAILEEVRLHAAQAGKQAPLQFALSRLGLLATKEGRFDRAVALLQEAENQSLHLGDRNWFFVNRSTLASVLVECGRPAEAARLLKSALEGPREGVEPDRFLYANACLADALMNLPERDDAAIRELIQRAIDVGRRTNSSRGLLLALVYEMERRVLGGLSEPIEPVRAEYDRVLETSGIEFDAEPRVRVELTRASALLLGGDAEGALEPARSAAELATRSGLPGLAARATVVVAEALRKLGDGREAEIALGRGRELLDEAASRLEDPEVRRDYLARSAFQPLRDEAGGRLAASDRRLLALYDMIRALNSETDPEALLQSILDSALRVVQAERGMILLRGSAGEEFSIRLSRNLEKETADDAETFSRTIAAQASEGKSVLALDAGSDERFLGFRSISLYRIRSLMCVPLRSRGRLAGTVYVDSRREGRLFTPDDLRFLEAFADHAALALENARARADLERENRRLQAVAETRAAFGSLVGRSAPMQRMFDLLEKVSASDLPVLILGESGTGKELVARAIHFNGARKRKVFLSENCAAIPETLLESELFGHVRGAFTGADRDRAGLFEQADGGTLFLDEIGDMSPGMQARLLRALEEGEVRRVGSSRPIHVDVRVLAATHRDLQAEVSAGRFREDLMYRLQVLVVQLPPLRERPGDVALLADHFLERIARERGRRRPRVERDVLDLLERYPWPGNVRQLENALQRLSLLAGDQPIDRAVVESDAGLRQALLPAGVPPPVLSLEHRERESIRQALEAAGGNRDRAARMLGISRATIYRKIKEYRFH